jgi:hypothetical protein
MAYVSRFNAVAYNDEEQLATVNVINIKMINKDDLRSCSPTLSNSSLSPAG